ncbi:hypothetical protein AMJ83_02460 [candidate division WOR_3 bacterium SM23_42]|uniref:DUF2520 domain-containing protein n=1 Tax=candidate division WOR_3 bacterium SM23_42 TaxID=1703779 RepID=A0A0S8FV71_UNCW3|nr:MAG: hypothetical protein AMJ83_02460 [candidate division WOR_3 bacterium SM23_42]
MRVGLIGCGRVGVTLLYRLRNNNQVIGVYDIHKQKEKDAAKVLGITNNPSYKELIRKSNALFLGTPDHAILAAYKKAKPYIKGKKYVFHFSGLLPAQVLPEKKNLYRASTHPFATFPKITVPPHRKYIMSIQGDAAAVRCARKIFGPKYFTLKNIKKEQKVLYHLIGVFSSNLLVGLISSIYELAEKLNWEEKDMDHLVFPIIEETFNNIKKHSLKNALSGPLQRGDVAVIKTHLRALRKDKTLSEIYKALSRALLEYVMNDKANTQVKKILR